MCCLTLARTFPNRRLRRRCDIDSGRPAQTTGNKLKWSDFRKAECGADATATPAAAPAPAPTTAAKPTPVPTTAAPAPAPTTAAKPAVAPAPAPTTAAPAPSTLAPKPTAAAKPAINSAARNELPLQNGSPFWPSISCVSVQQFQNDGLKP